MSFVSILFHMFLAAHTSSTPDEAVCPRNGRCAVRYLFNGLVDDDLVNRTVHFIESANDANADEIILEINTPGGSVGAGFVLARAIEESDVPVTCVVDGTAESMGFYLTQSCTKRLMTKRSVLMAHEPSLSYSVEHGQPNEWKSLAEMMQAEKEIIAEHCQRRLKVSMEEYNRRTSGTLMWFMTWRDALRFGAVDGITKSAKAEYQRALKRN